MANLWIRTQNKENLVKIEHIYYYEGYDTIDEYDGFSTHEIWANKEEIELGKYKTEERCIEIIDEIQKLLQSNGLIIMKDTDVSELNPEDFIPFKVIAFDSKLTPKIPETIFYNLQDLVYEMPEE